MHKFCGNCAWLKNKAYPTSRFVEACREIAVKRGETPVEVFATLFMRRSLKSLVGDTIRGKTIQTIKAEIWSKITCYNLTWAIRGSHGF